MAKYRVAFEGDDFEPGLGDRLAPVILSVEMPVAHLTGENAIAVWQPATLMLAEDEADTAHSLVTILMRRAMAVQPYAVVMEALDDAGVSTETWRLENAKMSSMTRPSGIMVSVRYDRALRLV